MRAVLQAKYTRLLETRCGTLDGNVLKLYNPAVNWFEYSAEEEGAR